MKIRMIGAALVVAVAFSPVPGKADMSASDLGIKVAEKLVGSILSQAVGFGFDSLFGNSPQQGATIEQISDAIATGFQNAALRETQVDNQNLSSAIGIYVKSLSATENWNTVENIVNATANVQNRVVEYTTTDNFLKMMPLFISGTNARLAFMSEKLRYIEVTNTAARKEQRYYIGHEAYNALKNMATLMTEKLGDPARASWPCIKKEPDQRLYFPIGAIRGRNVTEKRVDVSKQYCIGNGRIVKEEFPDKYLNSMGNKFPDKAVINLSGVGLMKTTDIMEIRGKPLFQFAYKRVPVRKEYHLFNAPTLFAAQVWRSNKAHVGYADVWGDLTGLIVGWLRVVQAGDPGKLNESLQYAAMCGVRIDILKARFNSSGFNNWVNSTFAPKFRGSRDWATHNGYPTI